MTMQAVAPSDETLYVDLGATRVAYRRVGTGPALLLLHGWPLSGLTWRKVLPRLSQRFTCYVPDLAGAGNTVWSDATDFSFEGQARCMQRFAAELGLASYALMAHDTGATIGRRLALLDGARVTRLVLIDTEIPGHRPPWIPLFQKTSGLPGSALVFQRLLRSRAFVRSGLGFGGCFHDPALLDGEFHANFIAPLIASRARMEGQMRYLRGIDWAMVDALAEDHARIAAPVLFIWGAEDPIFPVERARAMERQLPDCRGFRVVDGARLLVHEEKPEIVAELAGEFLQG